MLREQGFVTHLPEERRYGLGVAAYELGSAYQRQAPLQRIARPLLQRLVDETTHNAHLAVLHGRDVLYVIEERAPGRPLLVTDVGVRLPATLTASGMAMLAELPAQQIRALFPHRDTLVQRDGRGPASVSQLRRELTEVRQRGYAVEDSSVSAGLGSVAGGARPHRLPGGRRRRDLPQRTRSTPRSATASWGPSAAWPPAARRAGRPTLGRALSPALGPPPGPLLSARVRDGVPPSWPPVAVAP